jgi:hypothetical protein
MSNQIYCCACGRRSSADFCSDACQRTGARFCACGTVLRRELKEAAYWFRKRRYCGAMCRDRANAQRTIIRWRDPEQRANLMRGLLLSANTEMHIQRARKRMMANRQNPQFNAALRHAQRLLTDEQVRAIRADTRSARIIGIEYGVSPTLIRNVRLRINYAEV